MHIKYNDWELQTGKSRLQTLKPTAFKHISYLDVTLKGKADCIHQEAKRAESRVDFLNLKIQSFSTFLLRQFLSLVTIVALLKLNMTKVEILSYCQTGAIPVTSSRILVRRSWQVHWDFVFHARVAALRASCHEISDTESLACQTTMLDALRSLFGTYS